MHTRLENGVVVEIFDPLPELNEDLVNELVEVDAEIGDYIHDGKNIGQIPSDFHYVVDGEWVEDQNRKQSFLESQQKLTGFEYQSVMCSATSEDQHGLTGILLGFQSGLINETTFKFKNGNTLFLTADSIDDFAQKWTAFRQSFFNVEESNNA